MSDVLETAPPVPSRDEQALDQRPAGREPSGQQPLGDKPAVGIVAPRTRKPPAILFLPRGRMGETAGWPKHLQKAQQLGFNIALLASPFAAAPAAERHDEELISDYDFFDEAFGGGDAPGELAAAAAAAHTSGLELMIDIAPDRVARDSPLLEQHPDWFVAAAEGAAFRHLGENDATVAWWDERITNWQAAGVTGFRCRALAALPVSIWTHLIGLARARDPGVMFMAWTIGLTPEQIAALRGAGFDHSFASSCWWDFRAGWLNEDAARVSAIAPAIALAAAPGVQTEAEGARRAIRFAAAYGAGWLMEEGFQAGASFDWSGQVSQLNRLRREQKALQGMTCARHVSSPGAAVAWLTRGGEGANFFIAVNPSLETAAGVPADQLLPQTGFGALNRLYGNRLTPAAMLSLEPGEVAIFTAPAPQYVTLPAPPPDTAAPRIAIEAITPQVDDGKYPARRIVGQNVEVRADIIADGHDKLAAEIIYRAADETQFRAAPMTLINNDRWRGTFPLERLGRYQFAVVAWKDEYATFVDEVTKKHAAGVPTTLELQEGMALLRHAASGGRKTVQPKLTAVLEQLEAADEAMRRDTMLSAEVAALVREAGMRAFAVTSLKIAVDAERAAAAFASWYEIFPRSQSGDETRHGTFIDVIGQLPRIAEMGFDVLYFPPIHPIGRTNRKGRNNTLTPAPDDPGSPYAVGAAEGGHDALHPDLGTLEDFHALRDAAGALGIELALDFAIQCAPDHPWLKEHPDWFDWRPDGSLRYAENPPKKYEDIVNVDFYAKGAKPALWLALRDVVQFWVNQGVKIFRVDNPHTKPLPFWEWLIADIRARHPDTMFLAEAFTRPKVMYRLAKIGFGQSYSYFTWRNTKAELTEYLTELTTTAPMDFFRPNFFVNTPDINPVFLQTSGRGGFLIRAALAATLSGLWGVYNGFELGEATPVAPGKEEYLDSEKYQIKAWDYDRPGNIVAEITRLNRIRRANAALHTHLGVEFLTAYSDQVLYFMKRAADGNAILAAISLDPFNAQDTTIELPLSHFGLPDDGALAAEDLMRDFSFTWYGKYQNVRLNPYEQPFCIWRVAPATL